jgi:hypothetical protein
MIFRGNFRVVLIRSNNKTGLTNFAVNFALSVPLLFYNTVNTTSHHLLYDGYNIMTMGKGYIYLEKIMHSNIDESNS